MNLAAFLELCDPNMKVAITNENGIGGASYLAWPEHGWTVKEALEELGCGGFHLCSVSIDGDMLYIEADENPWDFGSYWEGHWFYEPSRGYEVEITGTAQVMEQCKEDAIWTAKQMIEGGDVAFDFKVKEVSEDVSEHWAW